MATVVEPDETRTRAVDAAMAVFERALKLSAPSRVFVEEALDAAGKVYDLAQQAEVDDMMRRTGFISLEAARDGGMQLRLKMAHDIAAAMSSAFDALIDVHGAENYVEWEATATDPAREIAVRADAPDPLPPHRVFRVIVVAPGRSSPHELRKAADTEVERLRTVLSELAEYAVERQHAIADGQGLAQAALAAIVSTARRAVER